MKKLLKRSLALLICTLMLCGTIPFGGIVGLFEELSIKATAATYGVLTYVINSGKVKITDCNAYAIGTLEIPSTINGYTVTSIDDEAFCGCTGLTSVTIPDSVTNIGGYAFKGCAGLTSITIPDSVTSIGDCAFCWCDGLTSVTIGNGVTSIGNVAFNDCDGLTSITVDGDNQYYSNDEFGVLYNKDKTELIQYPIGNKRTEYIISDSVMSIGDNAFFGCDCLTSVTIPGSVTSIGNYAFYLNESLTKVYYTGDLADWCDIQFEGDYSNPMRYANSLYIDGKIVEGELVIPDGVTSIGDSAFKYYSRLTSLTIPDSVTSIGDGAFSYCTGLTSLTIPDSVTSIGDGAFFDCTGLTSVIIPDSVTSIGNSAFKCCDSLSNVTIPDSVTSIGDYAFCGCTGLTNVTIPNSVTSIGSYAFSDTGIYNDTNNWENGVLYIGNHLISAKTTILGDYTIKFGTKTIAGYAFSNCTELISTTIPNSVTNIGSSTFFGCTGLTRIKIPDSITSIGDFAFLNCVGLTSITIPNSVTSIGGSAFSGCTGLTNVTIGHGVTSITNYAFYDCTNLADVYYVGTKNEWNAITIDGYNECLTNATIHYNSRLAPAIEPSEYAILVNDIDGNPIVGAKVTWNSDSALTDKDGMAVFDRFTIGQPSITVEKKGYITYTNSDINYSKSSKGYEYITLYENSAGNELKLKSAQYYSVSLDGLVNDLLTTTKRISLKKGSAFSIVCVANKHESAVKYELYQYDNLVATSDNGAFSDLSIGSFKKGGEVKVLVYNESGYCVSTPLNLVFDSDKAVNGTGFSIGEKLSFSIDDEVPFVGGSTFNMDFPVFPIDFSVNVDEDGDSTIRVAINADIYGAEQDEIDGSWSKEEKKSFYEKQESKIEEIKDAISKMRTWYDNSYSPSPIELNRIKGICEETSKSRVPGLDKVNISILGYGEGAWNSDLKFSKVTVCAYIVVEATLVDATYQSFVAAGPVIVPVVFDVTIKGEAQAGGEISYEVNTNTFNGDLKLKISPELTMFGGVGIGKAISVGGYGSAILDTEIQIVGTTNSPGLNYVDLTGEAGFKAYFASQEFGKPWAYRTWNIYTRNKNPKNTAALKTASIVSDENSIYDIDAYSLQNLSYLKGESGWLGANQSGSGTLHISSVSNSTTEIIPLITQTYRDSRPMIASAGNTMVMIFMGSDRSRTVYNHTRVMYSVYDKATNSWSEPKQLDGNNTLDMTPYLYSDGTNIYVVYSDATKVFDEADSMETVITSQNIAVSKFNFESNGFDAPTVLVPSDGKYNSVPLIGMVDGVPTVLYQSNASNSVFGTTSDNSIIKVTLNGEKETIASNLNSVVGYAVGSKGVAYIIDSDNVLSTCDDRLLYLNGDFIESGVVSNPQFSSNGKLYWYSNGTVKEYDNRINEIYPEGIAGFTDSFKVLDNKIYYLSATGKNTSNIMLLSFEDGSWNQPVMLTDQDKIIDTFSITEFCGETISVMTRRNITITENYVDDECEIAWTSIKDRYDISVDYVDYEQDDVKPNSSLIIDVGISNKGTKAVDKLNVEIINSTGKVVYSQIHDVSIKPSDDYDLYATLPLGDSITLDEYTVVVTEVDAEDCDESDNSFKVKIGYSDFYVSAETLITGNNRSVMVSVKNNGYTTSGGTLYAYNYNDEEPVGVYQISKLSTGGQELCRIDVSEEMLGGKAGKLYFKFKPYVEQFNIFDNKAEVYIELCSHENIGDWVVETEASCLQPGEKVKRCLDCLVAMEYEEINPHGHGESETVNVSATCTESGKTYEVCSICGEAVSQITETNPLGHKEGQWKVLAEPTIYLEGYEILCCDVCNEVLDERIIPKKVLSKVTWIIDGQEESQTYLIGDLIIKPDSPQKEGYRFVGWTPSVPETMPEYDMTFTAVFEKVEVPEGDKLIVSIKNPSTTTINYGDSIVLHIESNIGLPDGAYIEWSESNGNFSMSTSADGTTCKISPKSSGKTVFTATVYDKDGNVISSASQEMTSRAGLWQKIVAFFKKIFGLTKTFPEAFKGIF